MAHDSDSSTRALAAAREQFLSAATVQTDAVRDTILASWWRSRTGKVAADHIELPYRKDPNLDTEVVKVAQPVLSRLQDQLSDLAVSVILTDESGVVLDRRADDPELQKHLDRVYLAPGFSYAEEFVGTNGIGTALEGLQPTAVFGHEHYAEQFDTLACAGVPIRHPVSGQVVGLLDLTCWSRDAGPMMMTLAKATAQEIQKELTTQVGLRELSLFTEYMRACRRGHGIVFAINNDLVMTNEHARQILDPQDQAAMLAHGAELLTAGKDLTRTIDLPSGAKARLSGTAVISEAGPAGGVIRARLTREAEVGHLVPKSRSLHLPGIVGSGALWLRACQDVLNARKAGEWLTVDGERGAGKLAIVRAVHQHSTPAEPLTVIDLADHGVGWPERLRDPLRESSGTIVLRHLDQLPPESQRDLAEELAKAAEPAGPWLVATTGDTARDDISSDVIQHFPGSATVPPLRHHIDDVREIVPFLLLTLSHNAQLTCAPATVQLMLRAKWPGNVGQLRQVLSKVVQRRRSGTIQPEDLPPEVRTMTRRVLTPLESMERDAIVSALLDAEGNKTHAAQSLGMSRATIYRKIRDYGIDIPT